MNLASKIPLHPSVTWVTNSTDGLIALNKGVRVLSHPNNRNELQKSLLQAEFDLKEECYYWENADGVLCKLWLVNRLDSPTSGLVLLADNLELKNALRVSFEQHEVVKEYYAVVRGSPAKKRGVWSGLLPKNRSQQKAPKQSQFAKTHFQLEATSHSVPKLSCLKLNPVTGRTHQLRMHCADNHLPILGDQTYGDFKFNRSIKRSKKIDRLMLHCGAVKLNYTLKGKAFSFEAKVELPECFNSIMHTV